MASLGAIGVRNEAENGPQPTLGASYAFAPLWYNPFNRALGTKNDTNRGPQPFIGAYFTGGIPYLQVNIIIGQFGQAGGGVSIF